MNSLCLQKGCKIISPVKLVDMHLDGMVDVDTYRTKIAEYKNRQREITTEMQNHIDSDETCIITAQTVLDLARRAREIFESSNMDEKQRLLKFLYSNLLLDAENLHVKLREPFLSMLKMANQPDWLGRKDSNLRCQYQKLVPYRLATPHLFQ